MLTLAAAGAAAWYARKAAIHTEESAVEARRAANIAEEGLEGARHATRPYLQSEREAVSYNPESKSVVLHVILRNAGTTPAHALAGGFVTYYRKDGRVTHRGGTSWRNGTTAPNGVIDLDLPLMTSDSEYQDISNGASRYEVTLDAWYTNAFDETWEYTHRMTIDQRAVQSGIAGTADCKQARKEPERPESHQPKLPMGDVG